MTIWAGQILSSLRFTVWAYSNNFLLANHTLRTQFKFLSCFEANRGRNGLDQVWSVRKVLIGAKWWFGPWPNHTVTFHFYLLITHSPHSFSSSNALSLLLSSSLLSPMCFFDLLITASKDYEWADWIGQCDMLNVLKHSFSSWMTFILSTASSIASECVQTWLECL